MVLHFCLVLRYFVRQYPFYTHIYTVVIAPQSRWRWHQGCCLRVLRLHRRDIAFCSRRPSSYFLLCQSGRGVGLVPILCVCVLILSVLIEEYTLFCVYVCVCVVCVLILTQLLFSPLSVRQRCGQAAILDRWSWVTCCILSRQRSQK